MCISKPFSAAVLQKTIEVAVSSAREDISRAERQAATEQDRYDFLRTDLALCSTFVDLVETELDYEHVEIAERVFSEAERGYATVQRLLAYVRNPEQYREIEQGLGELRTRLDRLKPDGLSFHER
jgi:hypothetical protein